MDPADPVEPEDLADAIEDDPSLTAAELRLPIGSELSTADDCSWWYDAESVRLMSHLFECTGALIPISMFEGTSPTPAVTMWVSAQSLGRAWSGAENWSESTPASQTPQFVEYDWRVFVLWVEGDQSALAGIDSVNLGIDCNGIDTALSSCVSDGDHTFTLPQMLVSTFEQPITFKSTVTFTQSSLEGSGPDKLTWWSVRRVASANTAAVPLTPPVSHWGPDSIRCDQNTTYFLGRKGCVFSTKDNPEVSSFGRLDVGQTSIEQVSQHVLDAIDSNNPDIGIFITPPRTEGKVIAGGWVAPPLTRDNSKRKEAGDKMRPVCHARSDYNATTDECDEYPFASTLENAANEAYDYSVRPVLKTDNREAGRFLSGWYAAERILKGDQFVVYVQVAWDCSTMAC